jgi:cytidylate kinase
LRIPEDAVVIDSTGVSIDEVFATMIAVVREKTRRGLAILGDG